MSSGWKVFLGAALLGAVAVGLAAIWLSGLPYGSFEEAYEADGVEMVASGNATNLSVKVLRPDAVTGLGRGQVDLHALVYDRTGPAPVTTAAAFGEVCDRTGCETTRAPHRRFGVYVAEDLVVERDGAALRVLVTTPEGRHLHFVPP